MINIAQIKWYFSKLPIEKIGFESGFIQIENKLTALSFVLGFFESFSSNGEVKTSLWVQRISHIIGQPLSIQGLIVLCLVPTYNYFQYKIYQTEKRFVSLAKFADYYRQNFQKFVNELDWDKQIPFIKAFCLYEKRKNQGNYFEKIYTMNSC